MGSRKGDEEPLKAVVFADDCGSTKQLLFPCTQKLLNIPILSWQLGVLARYGIKEAVVLSSKPIQNLWKDPLQRMKVSPLCSNSWTGEGDALRELESHDGLRPVDDFVLVRQGAIFNVQVDQLVAQHKRRKDVDRNWLVTTVFRKGAGSASTGLVIGVESKTGTLVKYVEGIDENGISIDVQAENAGLQNGGTLQICADVVDVGLDVCAPDFLLEFRENFYYDQVRAYIKEKLDGGEAEVFGNRMYAHFLNSREGQFGTRIHSLASLSQASSDVLSGWMNPINASMITGKEMEVSMPSYESEYLLERSVVGTGTSIAVGSTIVESVIGDNVKIGSDVIIRQSVVMDNAVIRDRCSLSKTIVEDQCIIEEGTQVRSNCYLDSGVYIGMEMEIQPNSLITIRERETFQSLDSDAEDDERGNDGEGRMNGETSSTVTDGVADIESQDHESQWVLEEVGEHGKGRLIDEAQAKQIDSFFGWKEFQESFFFEDEEDDELEEEDEGDASNVQENGNQANGELEAITRGMISTSLEDNDADDIDEEETPISKFNKEVAETIERAFTENIDVDNTTLEVNSLKFAYNCSFAETLTGIVAGLARTAEKSAQHELYGAVDSALEKYKPLATKFVKEDDSAHNVQVASGLANALGQNGELLMYVFKAMYDKDMLEEDGILGWSNEERQRVQNGAGNEELLKTLSPLLGWLENSDEEDDEEDE